MVNLQELNNQVEASELVDELTDEDLDRNLDAFTRTGFSTRGD